LLQLHGNLVPHIPAGALPLGPSWGLPSLRSAK